MTPQLPNQWKLAAAVVDYDHLQNGWTENDGMIKKVFRFADFEQAIRWMVCVSPYITGLNHHPTWTNTYNRVSVSLSTHEAGNTVTDLDIYLAKCMDKEYAQRA